MRKSTLIATLAILACGSAAAAVSTGVVPTILASSSSSAGMRIENTVDGENLFVHVGRQHLTSYANGSSAEVRARLEANVLASQRRVSAFFRNISNQNGGRNIYIFTEGVTVENQRFVDAVSVYCRRRGDAAEFTSVWGNSPLIRSIVGYVEALKGNGDLATATNQILLQGAEWELHCNRIAQIRPAETREGMARGHQAIQSIRTIKSDALEFVWQRVQAAGSAEYRRYSDAYDQHNALTDGSNLTFTAELTMLRRALTDAQALARLDETIVQVERLAEDVNTNREAIVVQMVARQSNIENNMVFTLFGAAHDFSSELRSSNFGYARIS